MSQERSVTGWLRALQAGRRGVSTLIWNRYYGQLVRLVRRRVRSVPRRSWDEEDVAVNVFDSFFRRARVGGFPQLKNRSQLWRVLATIARRKAANQLRDQSRLCRGGDLRTIGENELAGGRSLAESCWSGEDPERWLVQCEQVERALAVLPRADLVDVAAGKLAGETNAEIAARVQRSIPTVERRWKIVRETWRQEGLL